MKIERQLEALSAVQQYNKLPNKKRMQLKLIARGLKQPRSRRRRFNREVTTDGEVSE